MQNRCKSVKPTFAPCVLKLIRDILQILVWSIAFYFGQWMSRVIVILSTHSKVRAAVLGTVHFVITYSFLKSSAHKTLYYEESNKPGRGIDAPWADR